jgi:hypothetical protein
MEKIIRYSIDLDDSGEHIIFGADNTLFDDDVNKLFAITFINNILTGLSEKYDNKELQDTISLLGSLGFELNNLIISKLNNNAMITNLVNTNYDFSVQTKDDLFCLKYNGFFIDNLIYKRYEGLKVLVEDELCVYELIDGIDNENWKCLTFEN